MHEETKSSFIIISFYIIILEIEETAAIIALPLLVKERGTVGSELLKICNVSLAVSIIFITEGKLLRYY